MSKKRLTHEYVKQYFSDNSCELLDEFINVNTSLIYKCSCGNISKIRFNDFRQGKRCLACGMKKTTLARKHSYCFVYDFFKNNGCELIENKYINNSTKMKYKCSCGDISEITFNKFKQGRRCSKCGILKLKLNFEHVKQYYKDQNCELLETKNINSRKNLKFKCSCGGNGAIRWDSFKSGQRCRNCSTSINERIITEILKKYNIKFEPEKKFNHCKYKLHLKFDFYLPEHNLCIEYDGRQHFMPITFGGISTEKADEAFRKQKRNDAIKTAFCHASGIKLLRISYKEKNNIEEIIIDGGK